MDIVRRRVDDPGDRTVGQHLFVARCRMTIVFLGKSLPLVLGPGEAGRDLQIVAALDPVGQNIGPPPHTENADAHFFAHVFQDLF